jgi:hypothetical protein
MKIERMQLLSATQKLHMFINGQEFILRPWALDI